MSAFGCALLGDRGGWRVIEVDLEDCESLDDLLDLIRDYDEPARILAIEQDDEYAVLVRFDGSDDALDETVRVFLSNGRAADDYPLAAMFGDLEEIGGDPLGDDEDAPPAHDAAPFGDPDLVEDLGMKGAELIELAVHESTLPIELIESLCERLGCLDEFEAVRG
jgi:putative tRNA adenosine deaminase-associated protein